MKTYVADSFVGDIHVHHSFEHTSWSAAELMAAKQNWTLIAELSSDIQEIQFDPWPETTH